MNHVRLFGIGGLMAALLLGVSATEAKAQDRWHRGDRDGPRRSYRDDRCAPPPRYCPPPPRCAPPPRYYAPRCEPPPRYYAPRRERYYAPRPRVYVQFGWPRRDCR